MASLALGVKFNPASGGTGDFVYASAVSGYVGPAATSPAMVDGKTYRYRAESADLSQWEWGFGVYTASTQTIARTTITLSSTGSKVSFSLAPQVGITAYPADLLLTDLFAIRTQKFTASGTYTPDAHLLYATIECVGGGGGGGAATGNASAESAGGGGGSGAYSRKTASVATIGVSQAVTIGAAGSAGSATGPTSGGVGGDTSVGSLCVAKGGNGGLLGGNNAAGAAGAGGSGASGTGDFTTWGNAGTSGLVGGYPSSFVPTGGCGAGSFFGGGPPQVGSGASQSGNAANNYGAGGGGAVVYGSASNLAGGAGAAGVVVITEYCSQ